jgi:Flp pilus assembly pilin Flp
VRKNRGEVSRAREGLKGAARLRAALRAFVRPLLRDERGQATTEYILILSATIVSAAAIGRAVLKALDKGILVIGGQLEKDLKTGRVPPSVWTN